MAGRLNLSALSSGASRISSVALPIPQPPPIGIAPPKLGVVQGPGKITFTLNGAPRWLIDVSRFAGTPTLTTKADPSGTTPITLSGARLPRPLLPPDSV